MQRFALIALLFTTSCGALDGLNSSLKYKQDEIRAQNIVTELQSSLDMSVPGELPGTLYRLYDYVLHQLQQANLQKKSETIDEADKVITELREAWAEMLIQNPTEGGSAPTDSQPGSISLQA